MPAIYYYVCESAFCLAAIALNSLLLWLIRCRSTPEMKHYRRLLQMSCLADLTLAIVDLLCQPVVIIDSSVALYISNGFFGHVNRPLSGALILMHNVFVFASVLTTPVQFAYRLKIVCGNASSGHPKINTSLIVTSIVAFAGVLAISATAVNVFALFHATTNFSESAEVENLLSKKGWSPRTFAFGSSFMNEGILLIVVTYLGTFSLSYTFIIWCERRIAKILRNSRKASGAKNTTPIHKDVSKALISFAVSPLLSTAIPFFFFSASLLSGASLSGEASAFFSMFFTSAALLNPLFTIAFVKPYRKFFFHKTLPHTTHVPIYYTSMEMMPKRPFSLPII